VTELENIKFEDARKHLADLSDEELKARFWQLAEEVVEPMLDIRHLLVQIFNDLLDLLNSSIDLFCQVLQFNFM
jgi:hypothetical protein